MVNRPSSYVPGELLVKTRTALSAADARSLQRRLGAIAVRAFDLPAAMRDRFDGSLYQVRLPEGKTVPQAIAELRRVQSVVYAEPNYLVHELEQGPTAAPATPGQDPPSQATHPDDLDPRQWGLHNPPSRADIHASEAWTVTTGRRVEDGGPLVAIIDSGMDLVHPDLAANLWTNPGEVAADGQDNDGNGYVDDLHGYDFANRKGDPTDDRGHGTHVAGTTAALGDNGQGVVGVAWRATLMPLKFLGGELGMGTIADAIEAIGYASRMGARITSNSWGSSSYSQALYDAMKASPAIHICAAGNDGADNDDRPVYPACLDLDNVVSVAATTSEDRLASFSNRGLAAVDLAAPGEKIFSTLPGGRYDFKSGTSMAAPHVTGAAALIVSEFPDISNADLKARLLCSVDRVPDLDHRLASGGRLNVARALIHDDVPPSAPSALRAVEVASDSITLAWLAAGDDASQGTAASYELRCAPSPIVDDAAAGTGTTGWSQARPILDVPYPQEAGTEQRVRVPVLPSGVDTSWHFALRALDTVGNPSARVTTEATPPPVAMAFRDDFESGAGQWKAEGSWTLVSDNGNHFFSDSPGTDYPSDCNMGLLSRPFSLQSLRSPRLAYSARFHIEPNFDRLSVEVTADEGKSWQEVDRLSGRAPWTRRTCDLAAFEGQTIQVRFRLVSDGDIEFTGVDVDDVTVSGESPAPVPAP